MRTRTLLLTAAFTLLGAASTSLAQNAPAFRTSSAVKSLPAPPPDSGSSPASVAAPPPAAFDAPGSSDVSIKDASSAASATKSSSHDTLSVDFPDEEIRNILRNVADLFDLNLVIPETLQGKTSVKLHDVTWRQIFQVVLAPVGYTYIEDGNIIKVVSNESLQQEPVSTEIFVINYARAVDIQPIVATLVDPAAGGKIVVDSRSNSLVITERPSRMNRIRPIIEKLDRATDQVMIESKFVEITDNDAKNLGVNWTSLNGYNATITPQSTGFYTYAYTHGVNNNVGTNLNNTTGTTGGTSNSSTLSSGSNNSSTATSTNGAVTTTTTTGTNSGITNTGTNSSGTSVNDTLGLVQQLASTAVSSNAVSAVFSGDQFKLVLGALQQLSNSKIISNPTVVTLNNTEASINVAQEFPIPNYTFNQQTGTFEVSGFQYKDIGIILKVTPQVNERGFIKLTLAPEVSQNNGTTTFGGASGASIPIIATRKATTQVSLRDGYTMAIGGLISSNVNKSTNQIPLLGSIPILGYLFKNDSDTKTTDNLIIFITAKTLSAEGAPIEQIFNTRELREMGLHRSDLPGIRDNSSPFAEDAVPAKK